MKKYFLILLVCKVMIGFAGIHLIPKNHLKTSGARDITPFKIKGERYLAIAQLSKDMPNTTPNMNGGNSNVPVLIFKEKNHHFHIYQRIPSHGNESTAFFTIGKRHFLAVASIRSGSKAPYNMDSDSAVYEWLDNRFKPIQRFPGFATKGVTAFEIEGNQYLGFASGVVPPGSKQKKTTPSVVYRWNGRQFMPFQSFPTLWGYEFYHFTLDNQHYLGLTDHLKESILYRWEKGRFKSFQSFDETGGRVFRFYQIGNNAFLAFANIAYPSKIYIWQDNHFKAYQTLAGKGARDFLFFEHRQIPYLLRINFILGTREHPKAALLSPLYRWKNNQWQTVLSINTFGGVNASLFQDNGKQYIAVANSLSKAIRFDVDSLIYQVNS